MDARETLAAQHPTTTKEPVMTEPTRTGEYTTERGVTIVTWEILGDAFVTTPGGTIFRPCNRCGGSGSYSYNPMDGTKCFGCRGSGIGHRVESWAKAASLAKAHAIRRAKANAKAIAAAEAAEAAWTVWAATRGDLIAALAPHADTRGFLGDMADKLKAHVILTEAQEAAAYRTVAQRAERAAAQQAAGHWGVEGKRAEVNVTIRSAVDYEGEYGVRYLVVMETADGQTLKTWSSGSFGWDCAGALREADGKPVQARIKATVKKDGGHGKYNGTPQTEVQRVALIAWKES